VPRFRSTLAIDPRHHFLLITTHLPSAHYMLRTLSLHASRPSQILHSSFTMGKKKAKSEYNDFLEDTRYQSTNEIHSTLQSSSSLTRTVSPPTDKHPSHQRNNKPKNKNTQLTHFLCLPLVTSSNRAQLNDALTQLRDDVQRLTPVPPKAVRPVGTLHLTLGVMSLSPSQLSDTITHLQGLELGRLLRGITTKKMAEEASEASQTLANAIGENGAAVAHPTPTLPASENAMTGADLDPDLLAVQLRGLVPMQKPSQTSILYAEPCDKSGRLMRFSESVRGSFEERGWVLEDKRGLKLHATMLNTIYAKDRRAKRERGDKAGGTLGAGGGGGEESAGVGKQGISQGGNEANGEEGVRQDAKSWMRFDAEALMQAYDGFVWANDVRIDRVQICKMGARKILNEETGEVLDEQYEVVAEKRL
jgi:activating signal cointegrator complex subunit 1